MLWPPDVKSWLIVKDPNAGKDFGQEDKGITEDKMVGWSPTQWTWVWASSKKWWRTGKPGVCSAWVWKVLDKAEWLKNNKTINTVKVKVLVTQSFSTLCDTMNCSLPDSSVHGISQAIILEWVTISVSRVSAWPRDQTQVCCIAGKFFTIWATREALGSPSAGSKRGFGSEFPKFPCVRVEHHDLYVFNFSYVLSPWANESWDSWSRSPSQKRSWVRWVCSQD